eukprot:9502359-Pyramimonas_sp.AAC.1
MESPGRAPLRAPIPRPPQARCLMTVRGPTPRRERATAAVRGGRPRGWGRGPHPSWRGGGPGEERSAPAASST